MDFAITIDIEWTPDAMIKDTLRLLDEFDVPATLFSTHDDGISLGDRHERALHPNFMNDEDDREILAQLVEIFPDARGIRSHGLYCYTGLREFYPEFGITYESNYLMYGIDGIQPFWMYDGIIQFPIILMDDMWMRRGANQRDLISVLEGSGIKVFDFHPIHIYLNTPDIDYYEQHKKYYQSPDEIYDRRYEGRGVRDIFKDLLDTITEKDNHIQTLGDFADQFREDHPY